MARDRNDLKVIVINDDKKYQDIFKERNVGFIEHFTAYPLNYPSPRQMAELKIDNHIWTTGDKYWKLAEANYGDPTLWWVLAWFNKKPTEGHVEAGDLILIPRPLETILEFFNV